MTNAAALSLDGAWTLRYHADASTATPAEAATWPSIPVMVPGHIESALMNAGLVADLRRGAHVYALRAWEGHTWFYQRIFILEASSLSTAAELEFDGLDCYGTVWINGELAGSTANALVAQRLNVGAWLRPGVNTIAVRIVSAVAVGRARPNAVGEFHSCPWAWESLGVRKAGHQFGWDILPRLPLGGIWRSVRLNFPEPVRVRSASWITLAVEPATRTAQLVVDWDLRLPAGVDRQGWTVVASLTRNGHLAWSQSQGLAGHHGRCKADLTNVELWWPRDWGEPALYTAEIAVRDASGRLIACDQRSIGLRTVTLQRSEAVDGQWRGHFVLFVNGHRLWARGTNWTPLDALPAESAVRRAQALEQLWATNGNLARMWGGAAYEDDVVYDWCDAHGILVWQDFCLACGVYPQDDGFCAALTAEAEEVVKRLRHHACLALWCGGNETDEAHIWAGLGSDPNNDRLTRSVLPAVLARLDPTRTYLPNSPFLSAAVMAGGGQLEAHLWGPRDDWKGGFYSGSSAAFVSEIGYHGCPAEASLQTMRAADEAVWPLSGSRWAPQAVCAAPEDQSLLSRLQLLANQARLLIGSTPADGPDLVFASQAAQAEALKFFIERWRARKAATGGLLWWNLRDGWPLVSDAVIDWYGRRKLAFAAVARSQAPVCVLIEEMVGFRQRVLAVNDLLQAVTLKVLVHDEHGTALLSAELTVPANGIICVGTVASSEVPALRLLSWSGEISGRNHYLAGPRPWALADMRRWYQLAEITGDDVA